jgi:hypothetical protein
LSEKEHIFYFEATIKSTKGVIVIGLETFGRMPGSPYCSVGYNGKTGEILCDGKELVHDPVPSPSASPSPSPSPSPSLSSGEGDVVGLGLNCLTREIFCSQNGKYIGVVTALQSLKQFSEFLPVVGIQGACDVAVTFNTPFMFDLSAMNKKKTSPVSAAKQEKRSVEEHPSTHLENITEEEWHIFKVRETPVCNRQGHMLKLETRVRFSCDLCSVGYDKGPSHYCKDCNYDLCQKCYDAGVFFIPKGIVQVLWCYVVYVHLLLCITCFFDFFL